MNLSKEQIEKIKKWVSDGAKVGDVQKKMESEFGLNKTYMDVRFLLDDIDAQLKDEPEKVSLNSVEEKNKREKLAKEEPADFSEDEMARAAAELNRDEIEGLPKTSKNSFETDSDKDSSNAEKCENSAEENSEKESAKGLKVSLDETPRTGTYASGSVTFSDGAQVDWVVDMNGQLGLVPSVAGYSPPQEDIPEFQKQLQNLLGVKEEAPSELDSKIDISVSPIQRPDSLAFGNVAFSDGTKAEWRIDRTGQLVLIPAESGKNPPQGDMPVFQRKLSQMLSKMY